MSCVGISGRSREGSRGAKNPSFGSLLEDIGQVSGSNTLRALCAPNHFRTPLSEILDHWAGTRHGSKSCNSDDNCSYSNWYLPWFMMVELTWK